MVKDEQNGVKPMYRSREWNWEERQNFKSKKKLNWWNNQRSKVQYQSVLFVIPTPGGVLLKEVRKRMEELNKNSSEKIKIEEKGGLKIKDILVAKNPFKTGRCTQVTCPLCSTSEYIEVTSDKVKVPCNASSTGYRWQCITCKERNIVKIYEGETGRSARTRGAEHLKDLLKKREGSVLYKHEQNHHKNEKPKFSMTITKKFNDALTRQANEAIRIFSRPDRELLNSKSEFNHHPIARVVVKKN